MAGNIVEVSDQSFESEVLKSEKPTLVDFWAEWCGPCKALAPTLEQLAQEKNDVAKICKVNVDDNPNVAAKYGVRSIPTVILFNAGERVDQVVGNVPKGALEQLLQKAG